MERLKIDDCPFCSDGQVYNEHIQKFQGCPHCSGHGHIIKDYICACGKPCFMISTDKILFCGQKTCLEKLQRDIKEEKESPPVYTRSASDWHNNYSEWNGMGLGPFA